MVDRRHSFGLTSKTAYHHVSSLRRMIRHHHKLPKASLAPTSLQLYRAFSHRRRRNEQACLFRSRAGGYVVADRRKFFQQDQTAGSAGATLRCIIKRSRSTRKLNTGSISNAVRSWMYNGNFRVFRSPVGYKVLLRQPEGLQ